MSVDIKKLKGQGGGKCAIVMELGDCSSGAPVKMVCFDRFPEEIWLRLLSLLTDSNDIFSVLLAFPELNAPFQSKKTFWLFDLVVPHLTKYLVAKKNVVQTLDDLQFLSPKYFWDGANPSYCLDSRELLKLRTICKGWKKGVEMSLLKVSTGYPPMPVYKKDNDKMIAKKKTQNRCSDQLVSKYHLGESKFHSEEQVDAFLEEMSGFEGNPFPFKSVLVTFKEDFELSPLPFIRKVIVLLQKYGQHVEVLNLEFGDDMDDHHEMPHLLLNCLWNVPNVKAITIIGTLEISEDVDFENHFFNQPQSQQLFPPLLNLESFNWQTRKMDEESSWINRMIQTYVGGSRQSELKKMTIEHSHLNATLASGLTNLSELDLLLGYDTDYQVATIRNVLGLFPKGQIRTLGLSEYAQVIGRRKININDLLDTLVGFEIETVSFSKFHLEEKLTETEASTSSVPTVCSLCIDESPELSYDFLKRLPELQRLSVHVDHNTYNQFLVGNHGQEKKNSFGHKAREYFSVFDEKYEKVDRQFSIWNELPKLENLSFSVEVAKAVDDSLEIRDVEYFRCSGNKPFFCGHVPKKLLNGSI